MARPVHVESIGGLRHRVSVGRHELIVDEPPEAGGEDAGPTPVELLLAALGS
jgi:putative redox protein